MRTMGRVVVAVLSAGWVIPVYLALNSYLKYVADIRSAVLGEPTLNSFPFLQFSQQMLAVSAAWLFIVLLFWAYVGAGRVRPVLPNKLLHATCEDARA